MRLWDQFEGMRKAGADADVNALMARAEEEKRGARFNKDDQHTIQKVHDLVAGMCDKIHCARGENWQGSPNNQPGGLPSTAPEASMVGTDIKAGARHSNADLMQLKSIHDCAVACGAKC